MDVKLGHKHAETGMIPEDWSTSSLVTLTSKIGSGITPTGGSRIYKQEGRPFVRSQNIGWGKLILDDLAFIDEATHSTFDSTEVLPEDVFLNITGASIGRSAVADERVIRGNVNQHVCIIRPISKMLHAKFLSYFLLSAQGQRQIESFQAGGNRQGLNFAQIGSIQIPLPPTFEEQAAIADALSEADNQIDALDDLIAKKRNLKQGAMQELLTGEKRLPGFSGEWHTTTLKETCSQIVDGTHFTPTYTADGIPFYSVENVTNSNFRDIKFISPEAHEIMSRRCKPEKGDILLTRIGTLGITKLIDWDVNASIYVSLALLKLNGSVDPNYLYSYTKSLQFVRDVEKRSLTNAIPQKINMQDIGGIPIAVPPSIDEQEAIANVLSTMDAENRALEEKRDKTSALKQGMMQELLTGRTRLR